jgi:hypothetical protein
VVERRAGNCGDYLRENISSRGSVDDSDPVVTAATASERHKNDFVQRHRNSVLGDVVLDVVCDAPAQGLNREPEQSSLDRDTVPSGRVSFPLKEVSR